LIDTGGIEPYSEDKIMQQMKRQAEIAIETADIIIFMVDVKMELPRRTKKWLLCSEKPKACYSGCQQSGQNW